MIIKMCDSGIQTTTQNQLKMAATTHIWTSRSQPRDPKTGEIAFDMSFDVNTPDESWSRVPITAFMDLEDNSIEYDEVTDAINDWLEMAKQYPHVRRSCVCCRTRATKGKILCGSCTMKYGPTIEGEEEREVTPSKRLIEQEEDELAIRNSLVEM